MLFFEFAARRRRVVSFEADDYGDGDGNGDGDFSLFTDCSETECRRNEKREEGGSFFYFFLFFK